MTNKIELGKEYTLKNGAPVTCIGIADDLAWIRPETDPVAFAFTLDGKDVEGEWEVVFEPEWMEEFDPTSRDLLYAFKWRHTPEGVDFWCGQHHNPTIEGLTRWLQMHAEYAKANQNA